MKTKNKYLSNAEDVFYTVIWLVGYVMFMIFMGIIAGMCYLVDWLVTLCKPVKKMFILENE